MSEEPTTHIEPAPATYYASPHRASSEELLDAIAFCAHHPMIDVLLQSFGSVLAVLNEHRQIIALNGAALEMMGIDDAEKALGLRPGEAIDCSHARDHEAGCGTGPACASCGAVIAMIACQNDGLAHDGECTVTVERSGRRIDIQLRVRTSPLTIDGVSLMLLFLEDITSERRRESLERAFFHDVNNTLTSLLGAIELLSLDDAESIDETQDDIRGVALRLAREIQVQRTLAQAQPSSPRVVMQHCTVQSLLDELEQAAGHHSAALHRAISFARADPDLVLRTDRVLVLRVLANMTINALEATGEGGEVRVEARRDARDGVTFQVWNDGVIPPAIRPRIFQRFFTTKRGEGRGVGTFAMKLLGEAYLRGRVDFVTSGDAGTTFRLWLPGPPAAT